MDDLPLDGRVVLVRVDFNVSIGDNGKVDEHEDFRLEATLPTIRELQQRRCRIVLLTHLGEFGETNDLTPIRHRLEYLLKEDIVVTRNLFGSEVQTKVMALEPGGVILLPNVRSDVREEHVSEQFGRQLSEVADIYINEAFSVSHRAHTSVALLPTLLPSGAGRHTIKEISVLEKLKNDPIHPYVAIVSGAKIETKEKLLRSLLAKVDKICVGGQLANVFLYAQGKFKTNAYNEEVTSLAKTLLEEAHNRLILPVDVVVGSSDGHDAQTVSTANIPENMTDIWDVGSKTVELFTQECVGAKTIIWNGPLGRFEVKAYATGTRLFAHQLAKQSAYRVIGGGETVMMLEQEHLVNEFDHVSVGGGALVTYLEGAPMPGLQPLYATD